MRLTFLFSCFIFLTTSVSAQQQMAVDGLHTIEYVVPEGKITIYLTEKYVRGELMSGTFALEGKGKNDKQKIRNVRKLKEYNLKIGSEGGGVNEAAFVLKSPEDMMQLDLRNVKREEMGTRFIILHAKTKDIEEEVLETQLPEKLQEGMTTIYGDFDGIIANTIVMLNGEAQKVVAESPYSICLDLSEFDETENTLLIEEGDRSEEFVLD